jgi:hypothetical protein
VVVEAEVVVFVAGIVVEAEAIVILLWMVLAVPVSNLSS